MTTRTDGRTAHLVAYGFDPDHPELVATLARMRHGRETDFHTIASSLRAAGRQRRSGPGEVAVVDGAQSGQLAMGDAIGLIHRAGGRAFLAHPLVLEPDPGRLEELVSQLKLDGLDGIEAVYAEFSVEQQGELVGLARKHDLLVCAGTDYHGIDGLGSRSLGIEMPHAEWLRFRSAVLDGPGLAGPAPASATPPTASTPDEPDGPGPRVRLRPFVLRIVLPAVAALVLLLITLWALLLPSFEQTLLERKRELTRELTESAWSILAAYEAEERAGMLTREEAQAAAADVVSELRYGQDRRDYFWNPGHAAEDGDASVSSRP